MDKQITMRWWEVSRADIPEGREERIEWLYGWWERVDAWIEENRGREPRDECADRAVRPATSSGVREPCAATHRPRRWCG